MRHSKQIIEDSENRVTTHFWDGQNIVLESSTNGSTKAKYIRGLALIAQIIGDQGFYYLHNGHGDVVQRIDSYGNPLVSYAYDAFGNQLNQSDTDPNPFRYCGEYFDEETCTYYIRARYYDQSIGRWHAEDETKILSDVLVNGYEAPIPLSLNLYVYCHMNPILFTDETGNWIQIALGAAIGGVFSAGINAAVQLAVTGEVDLAYVGIAFVTGAINGGLIAAGVPSAATGAITGGVESILTQGYEKGWDQIDPLEVATSAAVGAVIKNTTTLMIRQVVKPVIKDTLISGVMDYAIEPLFNYCVNGENYPYTPQTPVQLPPSAPSTQQTKKATSRAGGGGRAYTVMIN